jgi:MFS family permease
MKSSSIRSVIAASSVGTMIEWYDFYIFGSLATLIATKFFPQDNPTAAFLSTLATFAAGFVVRPFGALFFGRLGDIVGRKYTFMMTLLLMGGATFLIGCVPSYETIGYGAPALVLILRLLQGLALGGEYGGAATYVAEHSPDGQRGYWTSWIQTTATLGLFISLLVIMSTKSVMSKDSFEAWGWRVPFWLSIFMVGVSYLIRKNMSESPLFVKAKEEGKIITNPIRESFGKRYNFKYVLLALLGATMGQGVIWYTGHYYAMNFLKTDCKVDGTMVEQIMTLAFVMGTPFFVVFGRWSDRIGRKPIIMAGMLLAILSYFGIYKSMYHHATLSHREKVGLLSTTSEERIVNPQNIADSLKITTLKHQYNDGTIHIQKEKVSMMDTSVRAKVENITKLNNSDFWWLVLMVFIQVIFVTMVYGPIAAFLVELFPTVIRYTSMSLPYHIGNGVFGGLMPAIAAYLTTSAQSQGQSMWYVQGLWYPVIIGSVCFVIGMLYLDNHPPKNIAS